MKNAGADVHRSRRSAIPGRRCLSRGGFLGSCATQVEPQCRPAQSYSQTKFSPRRSMQRPDGRSRSRAHYSPAGRPGIPFNRLKSQGF
jgi:hypothetical protein